MIPFVLQHFQGRDQLGSCDLGFDDLVHVTLLAGDVGIGEFFAEFIHLFHTQLFFVLRPVHLTLVHDLHRPLRPHHGDFCRRVRIIDIGPDVFGGHDAVGAAVGFACDQCDFRDRGFGESVQKLGAMADDTAVFLGHAGKKTRHIFQRDQRDVEGIAEPDKPGPFIRGVDIQHAGQMIGLIGHNPDRLSPQPSEPDHDVFGIVLLNFEKVVIIHDLCYDLTDIVGLVRVIGHYQIQVFIDTLGGIGGLLFRGILHIIIRDKRKQFPYHGQRLFFIFRCKMGNSANGVMGLGASQLFHRNILVCHGFDDIRAGDEHVARSFCHDDEIRHGRRVHRPSGTRADDRGYLRDDSRSQHIPQEDVRIPAQAFHTFLNPGSSRIIEPDHRRPDLHGQVHDLDDLGGIGGTQGPAEHGEILCEYVNRPAFYGSVPRDNTVPVNPFFLHAEIMTVVDHEFVRLLEGPIVQQEIDPFPGREFAGLVLAFYSLFSPTELG